MNRSASQIYSDSFEDLRSNPVLLVPNVLTNLVYFAITATVGASIALNHAVTGNFNSPTSSDIRKMIVAALVLWLVEMAGFCLLQCMAVEAVTEGRASLGSGLRSLGEHFVPFLGALFLQAAIGIVVIIGGMGIAAAGGAGTGLIAVLAVGAALLFLFFTFPAIVYNDIGPLAALAESYDKVKKNFIRVLGFVFITAILAIGLSFAFAVVGAFFGLLGSILLLVFGIVFSTLVLMALTRLYIEISWREAQELEARKERVAARSYESGGGAHTQSWQQPL